MALYLGNQKVSLRSGQDPTFDYGFDSNGRLVFANKNATEINNFLNYDSSYSEILDLSNLSKMEKVAVNGTADRKMEGLKGLLVSPNAPFTGSSPQINVSYTGLNKNALVSLFESVPYNVGYTVVGSPTITDGVVSNVNNRDSKVYTSSSLPSDFNSFELVEKIKSTYITYASVCCLRPTRTSYVLLSGPEGARRTQASLTLNNTRVILLDDLNVFPNSLWPINDWLYVKLTCVKNNGTYLYKLALSPDKTNWVEGEYQSETNFFASEAISFLDSNVGATGDDAFADLNETYIKVNGVPWFGPGATKNLVPDGTVIGSPTITDGVVSGFSSNNYVKASNSIDTNYNIVNGFEVQNRIKVPSYNSGLAVHYFTGSGGTSSGLSINSAGKVYWLIGRDDTSKTNIGIGGGNTTTIPLNTYYYIRLKISNNIATLYSSIDGALWNTESTLDMTGMVIKTYYNRPFGFGHAAISTNNNYIFNGSIDLNNTYVKIGSDYVYRGMVPMIKTCSIVGATGTADLTQEDKNIILNKGWSLTVQ